MRSSLLTSTALACAALFVPYGAKALPIHVGLLDASGNHSWTSPVIADPHGTLTLTAWEFDSGHWTAADMDTAPGFQGLGVTCNTQPASNACSEGQIGSVPWQVIDVDITALTGWNGLTLKLDSVDGSESAFLLAGASCAVGGNCTPSVLAQCTNQNTTGQTGCSFFLSKAALTGITDVWVTPSATNPKGVNSGNIVLDADFILEAVPEPAALGIFGFGLLLIGAFVGLRRRRIAD